MLRCSWMFLSPKPHHEWWFGTAAIPTLSTQQSIERSADSASTSNLHSYGNGPRLPSTTRTSHHPKASIQRQLQPSSRGSVYGTDLTFVQARGPISTWPRLSKILESATVTPVSVTGRSYELIVWGPLENRRGWFCNHPLDMPRTTLHPQQREFMTACGGILERFGCSGSRGENMAEVLTEEAAATRFTDVIKDSASWVPGILPDDHR